MREQHLQLAYQFNHGGDHPVTITMKMECMVKEGSTEIIMLPISNG
jgi:hypothetical protein